MLNMLNSKFPVKVKTTTFWKPSAKPSKMKWNDQSRLDDWFSDVKPKPTSSNLPNIWEII